MSNKAKWRINVPVATVWTTPQSARDLDQKAISSPADITGWLNGLSYENSLELCSSNLVQSQVLYGGEVLIDRIEGDWAYVFVPDQPSSKDERGYPGWIPLAQITKEIMDIKSDFFAVITNKKADLFSEENECLLELSYMTKLPVISEEKELVRVSTPGSGAYLQKQDVSIFKSIQRPLGNGASIVKAGEQFIGLPYLWGGMSSYGYDCSGFAYAACRANGYDIPRDASDQAQAGLNIDLEQIRPGDLLFFAYEEGKGKIHHVGIYYGDGRLLHSPKTGKTIEVIELQNTIYEKELCTARRYWRETEES
ncbi:C40 family peptidase [Bacillus mesophilum]|uniref:NlpC/P60 family protein n=1 Tax=Bacillus mesophilum TaxID=1071718 RepID=A0A7V7RJ30_9BACI|nr:C40 family peptidase [Bacillus mesophilum]KAB2330600.1 NlpC/P60 family protein [Bacillus mesophilum]